MTEPTDEAPETEPTARRRFLLARLAGAVRRQDWFAVLVEVAVVVLGVVIGFQVTAWGQARGDRAKERSYLVQLVGDLRETEQTMARYDSLVQAPTRAEASLRRAFYLAERPSHDSLFMWHARSSGFNSVRPVLGTAEALVATGDLGLIRSDSLRAGITSYLDRNRLYIDYAEESYRDWKEGFYLLNQWFDASAAARTLVPAATQDSLWRAGDPQALPPDALNPFPLDAGAFLADRAMAAAVGNMVLQRDIMARVAGWMSRDAAALRTQVEAHIAQ